MFYHNFDDATCFQRCLRAPFSRHGLPCSLLILRGGFRFKDGSIVEAVVWTGKGAQRHRVVEQASLSRHLVPEVDNDDRVLQ